MSQLSKESSISLSPHLPFSPSVFVRRQAMRPTMKAWVRHSLLFVLTFFTTTLGGILFLHGDKLAPNIATPTTVIGYVKFIPLFYFKLVALVVSTPFTHPAMFADGLIFSISLLAILTAHEAGHYIACRIYGVDATLPFFIPSPPLIGPGTFGAFIKIVSPIWSRRALFDIGVAGPLAGFVVIIPVAIAALLTAKPISPAGAGGVTFTDPMLIRIFAFVFNIKLNLIDALNPFYFAAWLGLLVTSLNLIPVGQLDGAHAIFAVFGQTVHKWLGKIAFVTMVTFALLGWFLYSSPSGFLYAILLAIMLRVRHPQPEDMTPLDTKRRIIAVITLIVFALCFVPFPIKFH